MLRMWFLTDVNDACYHVHTVQASMYIVCSNFKHDCRLVTSVSNMYAAKPG